MANYFIRKADFEAVMKIQKCVYCGSSVNLVIDHIHPRNKGGGNELSNLTRACNRCNLYKSDFTIDVFLQRIVDKRSIVKKRANSFLNRAERSKRRGNQKEYTDYLPTIIMLRKEHSYFTRIIHSLTTENFRNG